MKHFSPFFFSFVAFVYICTRFKNQGGVPFVFVKIDVKGFTVDCLIEVSLIWFLKICRGWGVFYNTPTLPLVWCIAREGTILVCISFLLTCFIENLMEGPYDNPSPPSLPLVYPSFEQSQKLYYTCSNRTNVIQLYNWRCCNNLQFFYFLNSSFELHLQ